MPVLMHTKLPLLSLKSWKHFETFLTMNEKGALMGAHWYTYLCLYKQSLFQYQYNMHGKAFTVSSHSYSWLILRLLMFLQMVVDLYIVTVLTK